MSEIKIKRVEDMPVFGLFDRIALQVEKITREFPSDFRWLRIQVLRSSESVTANMTEGFYSQYSTEYLQSLHRCRREDRETIRHLTYAKDVGLLSEAAFSTLTADSEDALQQLNNVMSSIDRKMKTYGKSKVREDHEPYDVDDNT